MSKSNQFYIHLGLHDDCIVTDIADIPELLKNEEFIHVIEYSAYEKAIKERDSARRIRSAVNEKARSADDGNMAYYVKCEDLKAERAKNQRLVEALKDFDCECEISLPVNDFPRDIICQRCEALAANEEKL